MERSQPGPGYLVPDTPSKHTWRLLNVPKSKNQCVLLFLRWDRTTVAVSIVDIMVLKRQSNCGTFNEVLSSGDIEGLTVMRVWSDL